MHVDTGKAILPTVLDGFASQTDEFSQEHKGALDILLVIDNSSSMGDEQDKLSQNLPDLLKHVSGSNWQIAVIGTKINDCLSERITKATPNYRDKYRKLIKLGAQGNGEYHFYQALQGLQGKCRSATSKWLRQDSSIAVLIVSDQFNECHGYTDGGPGNSLPAHAPCTSSKLASYLNTLRSNGTAQVYGLILTSDPYSSWTRHIDADPSVLTIFAAYGLIDDTSYSSTLQKISQNVQTTLADVFTLSQQPHGEVVVSIDGGTPLDSSQYAIVTETKQLKFDQGYVPPPNAKITASYCYAVE